MGAGVNYRPFLGYSRPLNGLLQPRTQGEVRLLPIGTRGLYRRATTIVSPARGLELEDDKGEPGGGRGGPPPSYNGAGG